MLTIHFNEGSWRWPKEWHVGENAAMLKGAARSVTEIIADGDELTYLKYRFNFVLNDRHITETIPSGGRAEPRVIRYYGDDAKFIVGNLT